MLIPTANPIPFTLTGINEPEVERAHYRKYYQKFQRSDSTTIQILVPVTDEVKDWGLAAINETEVLMPYVFNKQTYADKIAGYHVQEFTIDFSQFKEGKYRFILSSSSPVKFYTDLVCVKDIQPHTQLLSYRNTYNTQSVAFSTGVLFRIRVEYSDYKGLLPRSEDNIYAHDYGAYKILSSHPFGNKRVFIGGKTGIPDWLLSIVNQVFSCDTLHIGSTRYAKAEGATLEALEAEGTNLRSWSIEIGKVENSLLYEDHIITINGQQEYTITAPYTAYGGLLTIFSTTPWRVVPCYPDWITVTPTQGSANGQQVAITLTKNESRSHRFVTLQFQSVEFPSLIATIHITQVFAVIRCKWDDFINIWKYEATKIESVWSDFINIWLKACQNDFNFDFSRDFNCGSPERKLLKINQSNIWLPHDDIQGINTDVESNTDWIIE